MEFDHIAVSGETLALATAHVEAALDVCLQPGGQHAVFHTHNTLLGLNEGLYLEAIAVNPDAPQPARPRWFDLDRFSGVSRLTNWICRCADLDATLAALPEGFGAPVSLARGELRWRMAVPSNGVLPFDGCAPALIEWDGDAHPAQVLRPSGIGLKRLRISHPDALELEPLLKPFLDDERLLFEVGSPGLEAQFDQDGVLKVLK